MQDDRIPPWVLEIPGPMPPDAEFLAWLKEQLKRFPLLIVRNAGLDEEKFHAVMNLVGTSIEQKFNKSHVVKISSRSTSQLSSVSELGWHADQSYQEKIPDFLCLFAINTPPEEGRTHWANTQLALSRLSAEKRARLSGLMAHHEFGHFDNYLGELIEFKDDRFKRLSYASDKGVHPVISSWHGQEYLCLNHGFTTRIESATDGLLQELLDHISQPEFVYSHQWQTGDFILSNNNLLIHRRDRFQNPQRLLLRGLVNI